jgi:hypothetical protein
LLSRKTDQEWKKKRPDICTKRFATLADYDHKDSIEYYSDVISDGKHIFISNKGRNSTIFVIDGNTLNLCHILKVQFNKDESSFCAYDIKMVTDENFLVAWVWNWER